MASRAKITDNIVLCSQINNFWMKRGFIANARTEVAKSPIPEEFPRTVIVSDLVGGRAVERVLL